MFSLSERSLKILFENVIKELSLKGSYEPHKVSNFDTYFDYGYVNEKTNQNSTTGVKDAGKNYGHNNLFLINKKLNTAVFCHGRGSNLVTSYIYVWKNGNLKQYSSPFVKARYNDNIDFDWETIKVSTWGELIKSYFALTKFDFNKLLNDEDTFCIVLDYEVYNEENYK